MRQPGDFSEFPSPATTFWCHCFLPSSLPGAQRFRWRAVKRPVRTSPQVYAMEVLIIGAGIGGLTLGLMLHRAGIACRIFEAAPELKAVGVGINILPHASHELCELGLEDALAKIGRASCSEGVVSA